MCKGTNWNGWDHSSNREKEAERGSSHHLLSGLPDMSAMALLLLLLFSLTYSLSATRVSLVKHIRSPYSPAQIPRGLRILLKLKVNVLSRHDQALCDLQCPPHLPPLSAFSPLFLQSPSFTPSQSFVCLAVSSTCQGHSCPRVFADAVSSTSSIIFLQSSNSCSISSFRSSLKC